MARRSRRSTQRSRNRARNRARAQAAAKSRRAAKSTRSQGNNTGRQSRGPNYAGLAKKLGVHPSVVKNRAEMRDRARERHTKFKQTRVQTFGGKKTSFSKAEQKRITDAGYSVKGYSKAPAQSNTQLQINKDNRMYGNTVPEGSFSISDAGKLQAEKNKAEAAAKRTVPAGSFNISAAGRAQAEANKAAAAAAKKEATRKSTFDSSRALNYAKGLNLFNTANMMAPGGNMASWYNTGADPTKSFRQVLGDEISMSQRTKGVGKGTWNPARGMPGYGSIRNVLTGKPFNTKFEGGFETGPTEANRRVFNNLGKVAIGTALFNQGRTGSLTDQVVSNTPNVNVGGLSIGFNSPESTDIGARVGKFFTSVPGKVANLFSGEAKAETTAGGLNIGGGVDSGDAPKSNLGRVLTFGKNLVQQPKAALAYGSDVAKQLFTPSLADGTLTGNTDFAGNLPGDKGFDNRDVQIKGAFNNAMNSNFVQQYGENLGLPKNFKAQTKDALAALGENYQGATADRDGIYTGTSETLKNLSSDNRLAPIAKYLNQLGTDNENVTDADRNKKFSMMGFETPFTNEMAADAITAFQPNVDKMPGLSFKDRGLIEGSGGNRIISGKLTDIAREAITGNIGTGDSLGIQKGTPLTIGNMIDAGSTIASNLQQDGTLASQRSKEIANLADKAGKITTPSLIKGLIPRFGGSGSFRPNAVSSLGPGATTLAAATPTSVEEVLPLPTTATQTGTDSGNLASIMQNAYQNQMSLYGMNPNYFANFRQPRFNRPRKRFRQVFNRGYF